MLTPELVDETVGGYDLAHPHEQEAQEGPLLLPSEGDGAVLADDFERPEDPEVRHRCARVTYQPFDRRCL